MRYNEEFKLYVELEKNIADEAQAREGYYRMLADFSHLFSERELEEIREIISEELKHSIMLDKMLRKRNGIIAE